MSNPITSFISGAAKTFIALILIVAGLAFYAGMRFAEKTADVPAPAEADYAVSAENAVVSETPAPASVPAAPKSTPSERANAVLFELLTKKKGAERRLVKQTAELEMLEAHSANADAIREARARIESLKREIANCNAAIVKAKAALAGANATEARERENAPFKALENL